MPDPSAAPAAAPVSGGPAKIRVLVVDDSALIRRGLTVLLNDTADIEVVGAARDGVEAETLIESLKPDVVTLDIEMPRMTGLELLEKMSALKHHPAVLMVSSSTKSHAPQTVRALELGASDYVFKQADASANSLMQIRDALIAKVRAVSRHRGSNLNFRKAPSKSGQTRGLKPRPQRIDLVVLGASAGGPAVLAHIFQLLPAELQGKPASHLQASLLVVQHMPPIFTTPMAARLGELSGLPVKVAEAQDSLERGHCLVAPGGRNLFVTDKRRVELSAPAETPGEYPKIDLAMVTAAEVYGSHLCGIILTGMGRDGTDGLLHARKLKCATFVQDPATCVVDGMPSAALKAKAADVILTPGQIASVLAYILINARVPVLESPVKGKARGPSGIRRSVD